MADDAAKRAWMLAALGVDVGGGGSKAAPSSSGENLTAIWIGAKEKADAGIALLQKALKQNGHPMLAQIADAGLNGVTDRNSVGIRVALAEVDSSGAAAPAKAKAAKAVQSFRAFLGSDIVKLIDENPFNVSVNLRQTLGDALDSLDSRLAS